MENEVTTTRDEMVYCEYRGATIKIPEKVFFEILTRQKLGKKSFVRYKEGAQYFGLSLRSFRDLAADADAVHRFRGSVLVDVAKVEEYLRFC